MATDSRAVHTANIGPFKDRGKRIVWPDQVLRAFDDRFDTYFGMCAVCACEPGSKCTCSKAEWVSMGCDVFMRHIDAHKSYAWLRRHVIKDQDHSTAAWTVGSDGKSRCVWVSPREISESFSLRFDGPEARCVWCNGHHNCKCRERCGCTQDQWTLFDMWDFLVALRDKHPDWLQRVFRFTLPQGEQKLRVVSAAPLSSPSPSPPPPEPRRNPRRTVRGSSDTTYEGSGQWLLPMKPFAMKKE